MFREKRVFGRGCLGKKKRSVGFSYIILFFFWKKKRKESKEKKKQEGKKI